MDYYLTCQFFLHRNYKDSLKAIEAREEERLTKSQKDYLELELRRLRRAKLLSYHRLERELLCEELNRRQAQLETAHAMLLRHHELTQELEYRQQRAVHMLREEQLRRQHQTELSNQHEYTQRAERELRKKHAIELKQQPKSLKQKEILIRKQFRETVKIQTRQYKALKAQVLASTPRDQQKSVIKKLKEDQRRKLALLGEQYEQSIAEMLQKQSVCHHTGCLEYDHFCMEHREAVVFSLCVTSPYSTAISSNLFLLGFLTQIRLDESQEVEAQVMRDKLQRELEILMAYQSKSKMTAEAQRNRERAELEERVSVRRALLEQKVHCPSSQSTSSKLLNAYLIRFGIRWKKKLASSYVNVRTVFDSYTRIKPRSLNGLMMNLSDLVSGIDNPDC